MSPDVAARALSSGKTALGRNVTTYTRPDPTPIEALVGFLEGVASVVKGALRWLESPAGKQFLGSVENFLAVAPKVEALHIVLIDESREEGDLLRAGSVLGLRRRGTAAAVLLAVGDVHTQQRVRLGRSWVKDDSNRVVAVVPSDDLNINELFRWFRARAFRNLPSTPRRSTRFGGSDQRRAVPVELTRLAAATPAVLSLTTVDAKKLLGLLENVASPRQLQLVHLRVEGSSFAEAARRLGINEATAYVQLYRLRGKRMKREARELLAAL